MKKKIGITIGVIFSILVAAVASVAIYLYIVSDTIELTATPAPDIQEQLDVYVEAGLCWWAYVDEDGTTGVIHLTQKQRKKWIEWITDSMSKSLEKANRSENIEYIVSDDRKVLTLRANKNMRNTSAAIHTMILVYDMEIYQVLTGEEDWSVHFVMEDMDTNEIIHTEELPGAVIQFNEAMWETKDAETDLMEEALKEYGFDIKELEIETYTYPEEFTLGPNLDMAITELALMYNDFDESKVDEDTYQKSFIRRFCQNSRATFDYLEKMREKASSYISKDHVRYIQYSLTKEHVDFKDNVTSSVNINQTTSSLGYGQILSYEAVEDGAEVHLIAEFERGSDGTEITTLHELTVVLVRNPYSCFDGYSIKSLSSKDITPVVTGDNKEHTFYGCDMEVEEDGVFTFENYGGEDDVQYGRHIKVDLSDNPALADFVRENAGAEFDVTYVLDENMTQPVYQVVPVSITLHEE